MTNDITWSPVLSHDRSYGCPSIVMNLRCCVFYRRTKTWRGINDQMYGRQWSWSSVESYAIPMEDYVRITGIDIDEIPDDAVWIAQDSDGEWCYYSEIPYQEKFAWYSDTATYLNHGLVLGSWKDTLIRPSDYPEIFGQRFAYHSNDEDVIAVDSQLPIKVAGYYTANNGKTVWISIINGDMCIGDYPGGGSGLWHRWSGNVWKDCEGWSSDTDEWSLSGYDVSENGVVYGSEEDADGFEDVMDDFGICRDMLREARGCFVEPHVLPSRFVKMQQQVIELSEWLDTKYYEDAEDC